MCIDNPPKVSVIIAVYNAEKYIERCAISLFEQTLDSIEYIFVNDQTPDNSFGVLETVLKRYPHRASQVRILNMPANSRQAAVRTAGMKAATGQYMIHCDPDDWVELDAYECLYRKAVETEADVVTCRYKIHSADGSSTVFGKMFEGSAHTCLKSVQFCNVLWNKLIKTDIIQSHHIYPFPDINCGEDLNVVFRVLCHSKRITAIKDAFYNYNLTNEGSITNQSKTYLIEKFAKKNFQLLEKFLESTRLTDLSEAISFLKIRHKRTFLWPLRCDTKRNVEYWTTLWPETRKSLLHYPEFSKFQRLIFFTFAKTPSILKIYLNYLDTRSK